MIFLNRFGRRLHNQSEGGIRVLLPNREVGGGDRQPAEREQVSAGLGNAPDLCPGDFMDLGIDHIASAFQAQPSRWDRVQKPAET